MPAESTLERICYRFTDPQTGIRYHQLYDPPPSGTIALRMTQREEDTEAYVKKQIDDYNSQLPGCYTATVILLYNTLLRYARSLQ